MSARFDGVLLSGSRLTAVKMLSNWIEVGGNRRMDRRRTRVAGILFAATISVAVLPGQATGQPQGSLDVVSLGTRPQ